MVALLSLLGRVDWTISKSWIPVVYMNIIGMLPLPKKAASELKRQFPIMTPSMLSYALIYDDKSYDYGCPCVTMSHVQVLQCLRDTYGEDFWNCVNEPSFEFNRNSFLCHVFDQHYVSRYGPSAALFLLNDKRTRLDVRIRTHMGRETTVAHLMCSMACIERSEIRTATTYHQQLMRVLVRRPDFPAGQTDSAGFVPCQLLGTGYLIRRSVEESERILNDFLDRGWEGN